MSNFVKLPFFSLINVSGEEAEDFLQRQFINDLGVLKPQHFQHNAWCSRRGQVICNFFIAKTAKEWQILLPTELASLFLERLQQFVLRSKVTLHPIDPASSVVGLYGAGVTAQLAQLLNIDAALDQGRIVQNRDLLLWRLFGCAPRYLLTGTSSALRLATAALTAANCYESVDTAWPLLDIHDTLPWLTKPTSTLFLPQYLSLDLQQAMSLNKGCYPGQEVIARLHYKGKIKYRLKAFYLPQAIALSAGHRIIAAGQRVGTVINAAIEKTRTVVLAVSLVDASNLTLEDLNVPLHALSCVADKTTNADRST